MNTDTIILLGSSRSTGNTSKVAQYFKTVSDANLIDISKLSIKHFDYDFNNQDDDFNTLVLKLLNYKTIVLASPIYWYTMSGILKVFLDRITDLLKINKELGRQLRGKKLVILSCSDESTIDPDFYKAFISTADYLGMQYCGHGHGWVENGELASKAKKHLSNLAKLI